MVKGNAHDINKALWNPRYATAIMMILYINFNPDIDNVFDNV